MKKVLKFLAWILAGIAAFFLIKKGSEIIKAKITGDIIVGTDPWFPYGLDMIVVDTVNGRKKVKLPDGVTSGEVRAVQYVTSGECKIRVTGGTARR